ncbi:MULTISPECIES: RNA polymerase sigma factor [Niastella]|uniref:Sigma-70 family RNA polymerase sigma factor n=1 Tax=Niastella soli TaxID=2821487 RepID=A0ABS3YT55_9BACT|nr:sigma-70 family RNA polymerase sigma factor [Niastella soli]MBO9201067.1 sigma-70 family RNA polymerase sigma factor [Niastella soli]
MKEGAQEGVAQLVDHLFRHQSGKMIAVLIRIFGMHNLEMIEDVVQESFLRAIHAWTFKQLPDNPAGWLMQVARNRAIDIIRRQQHFQQYSQELANELQQEAENTIQQFFSETEIADSQLRMIFACCHPALKEEDQIALTLKTVSGFGVAEIAHALLTNDAVIQKRLYRAKQFLKDNRISLEIPSGRELYSRLHVVYTVLYLLFNEGYKSQQPNEVIRKDLCAEAMRLCLLLTEHRAGKQPSTFALFSLMCFQASRFESRLDENNSIILLQHQDRNTWNKALIQKGYEYLNLSSQGDELSVYHLESAIAAEHCLASSFATTNWQRMLQLYDMLLQQKRTPLVILNRAIVLSQLNETVAALKEIWQLDAIEQLITSQYIYSAVLGELYIQLGDDHNASKFLQQALVLTTSLAEKRLITTKLETLVKTKMN